MHALDLKLAALPVHGSMTEKLLLSALDTAAETSDTAPNRPKKSVNILNRLQIIQSSAMQQQGECSADLQPQRSQQVFPAAL